ncbi:MAG: SDR family NAD(P)-dependent oxidoreductase [Nanoarchaeota archaeon]|nr:SDR family NAD(P)-dependent oxidoreductase [Nanoarchaeota archaeon]MBU1029958.1 SDR family NAD(P)-dependent oxidoreductase [Nanoarchaeota archaeon]MBU1849705.1 SDR family NAD(P)-dependent oxidoreductase [Nanoarchaeota archaeon]
MSKNLFKDKTILITGGTGFLGKHLITEILKYKPHSIRVFSRDEVKHHKIQELFQNNILIRNLIGDVRDFERLRKACRDVDIVIHAAALKRLDILEYNVEESIKTNILGTLNVVNACLEMNVEKAVFISTDKACSPVNTYGACKFVSERIFTESNFNKGNKKTIFTVVRYGNVLESTGSVIPFFESKIKNNEDIPLTDSRMTRFIISPEKAVQLVFDAIKYAVGGEVFVPKLPAFKITDLIDILKEKNHANNKIQIIGLRPGEKIHELMVNFAEIQKTYSFKNLYVITSCLEKYHKIKKADYIINGKKVKEKEMTEYSSEEAVIKKEEVEQLFKKLGLL